VQETIPTGLFGCGAFEDHTLPQYSGLRAVAAVYLAVGVLGITQSLNNYIYRYHVALFGRHRSTGRNDLLDPSLIDTL